MHGYRFGFIGTFPPTRCGLATFNSSLSSAIAAQEPYLASILQVTDPIEGSSEGSGALQLPTVGQHSRVVGQVVNGDSESVGRAGSALQDCDVVVIQHEFGIYGGPDGEEVLQIISQLSQPTIVVLHTVLDNPTAGQRRVIEGLGALASMLVVMTKSAESRLVLNYSVPVANIHLIPHGVPVSTAPSGLMNRLDQEFSSENQFLSWGLIGPGKGIEWGIMAAAMLKQVVPDVHYRVVGATHPKVLATQGDRYRSMLKNLIAELGVEDTVTLDGEYQSPGQLEQKVEQARAILLPYDSRVQVTSGVLVEALAAGKPVVSTQFPHARELINQGNGRLVGHENPRAMADALLDFIGPKATNTQALSDGIDQVPQLTWPQVAKLYRELASRQFRRQRA